MYKYGGKMVSIPQTVIQKFLQWNTYPFYLKEIYDEKVVQALLITSVGLRELINGNVCDDTRKFIFGKSVQTNILHSTHILVIHLSDLLSVRVKRDQRRLAKMDVYIQEYCTRLSSCKQ